MLRLSSLLPYALLASSALGATYGVTSDISGNKFYDAFEFQTFDDPTHGIVNYVNQRKAISQNLTFAASDAFVLRADAWNTIPDWARGRSSVRLQSRASYSAHVAVFNVRHAPDGCGTWPAIWEVGDNWPNGGETDIYEGVNGLGRNQATLHTRTGCYMPSSRVQKGTSASNDCQWYEGCGVRSPSPRSFGGTFNAAGGGWYALERTDSFIKVWFWSRQDGSVPADVRDGAGSVNTDGWGTPFAFFPSTASCNLPSYFGPHRIVINLTLCGDWAGSAYAGQGCPGSCVDYVKNNPLAFTEAYFDFAWMKVYQ